MCSNKQKYSKTIPFQLNFIGLFSTLWLKSQIFDEDTFATFSFPKHHLKYHYETAITRKPAISYNPVQRYCKHHMVYLM